MSEKISDKEWIEGFNKWKVLVDAWADSIFVDLDVNNLQVAECQHEWQEYKGFSEEYKFCRKCDEKSS